MEARSEVLKARLDNGALIQVEARVQGEERVAAVELPFDGVGDAIEGIARSITTALARVKPRKATVEFDLEVSLESGKLTALLVKGSGAASLKVTLEWEQLAPLAPAPGEPVTLPPTSRDEPAEGAP